MVMIRGGPGEGPPGVRYHIIRGHAGFRWCQDSTESRGRSTVPSDPNKLPIFSVEVGLPIPGGSAGKGKLGLVALAGFTACGREPLLSCRFPFQEATDQGFRSYARRGFVSKRVASVARSRVRRCAGRQDGPRHHARREGAIAERRVRIAGHPRGEDEGRTPLRS